MGAGAATENDAAARERLYAAGLAASEGGRPALAARRLRAALRLTGGADGDVRGRLLVSLAWAESERGFVDLGFQLLDEAEPLLTPADRAVLHAQRALMMRRNGRNDLALPEFDRAVAALSERDQPLDLVKALNNRSLLHLDAGRVGAARDDLHRALRIAHRHGLGMVLALLRVNVGCLDVVAGDLPSALGAFADARPAYEELAPGRLPGLAIERARALIAAGLFREADRELAAAVDQAGRQGQDHTRAEAQQVRAEAALLAGRPGTATTWAEAARAGFVRRGNSRQAALASLLAFRAAALTTHPGVSAAPDAVDEATTGRSRAELIGWGRRLAADLARLSLKEDARVAALVAARLLLAQDPPAMQGQPGRREAGAAARLVARYGPPSRHDRLDTRLLHRLTSAEIDRAAGRPRNADRQLVAGMAELHRHRARFGCLDLQTGASGHGRDLAGAGLAGALEQGSPGAVFRWSERARAQALLLPPVRPPDDPELASALEDLRQTRYALRSAELGGRSPAALRGRAQALQRRIREQAWATPRAGFGAAVAPARLSAVRAALGEGVLVAYVNDGCELRALVVSQRRARIVSLGEYRLVEEAVLRLRADLDTAAGRAMPKRLAAALAAATSRNAENLDRLVLAPLRYLIGDGDLLVVPTGLLMTAPWALLPTCTGRPVTVTPSATAWLTARSRSRPVSRTVLIAGPGNRRGPEEIARIAALHPSPPALPSSPLVPGWPVIRSGVDWRSLAGPAAPLLLAGEAATPAATLEALDGAAVAHVAAHGRHEAENALFSSLELAGGPILGYDLQRLGRAPGMVVLSSCEVGLTEIRPGDETFGMASALLAAGTATVVASVSRVADDVATEAMVRFHHATATGMSPAAALAAAAPSTSFVCLGAG